MKKGYIKFWGVRGSYPTPDLNKMVYGGDTSCVEVRTHDELFIFDMGSGLRNLGSAMLKDSSTPKKVNIFLSHYHWDHVFGMLNFSPLFDSSFTFNIYGANKKTDINEFTRKTLNTFINNNQKLNPKEVILYGFGRIGRLVARELIAQSSENNKVGTIESILAGVGSGLLAIPKGFFSLGATLLDLGVDQNRAARVEAFFDDLTTLDEKAEATTAGRITEALVNIGLPAARGFKIASKMADDAMRAGRNNKYFK